MMIFGGRIVVCVVRHRLCHYFTRLWPLYRVSLESEGKRLPVPSPESALVSVNGSLGNLSVSTDAWKGSSTSLRSRVKSAKTDTRQPQDNSMQKMIFHLELWATRLRYRSQLLIGTRVSP